MDYKKNKNDVFENPERVLIEKNSNGKAEVLLAEENGLWYAANYWLTSTAGGCGLPATGPYRKAYHSRQEALEASLLQLEERQDVREYFPRIAAKYNARANGQMSLF